MSGRKQDIEYRDEGNGENEISSVDLDKLREILDRWIWGGSRICALLLS